MKHKLNSIVIFQNQARPSAVYVSRTGKQDQEYHPTDASLDRLSTLTHSIEYKTIVMFPYGNVENAHISIRRDAFYRDHKAS